MAFLCDNKTIKKMEQTKQITLPEFIETNLQRTKQLFKIPTNPNKEFRSERRIVIREAYKLLLSKTKWKELYQE